MKRIQSACICQTLRFLSKEGVSDEFGRQQIKAEVEQYKKSLERTQTKYKIVEETTQADGSVMLKIIKQYNASPVGDYLD